MELIRDHISDPSSVEDLILLPSLTEQIILHVLRERYEKLNIYTSVGSVLLSINPFTPVPLYSEKLFHKYHHATLDTINSLPPHPWRTASEAYMQMKTNALVKGRSKVFVDQSVLISGESGSGKTETTKIIISFLTETSYIPKKKKDVKSSTLQLVQQKVQKSNPVLEALGNARTVRNDNSSRFGKYIMLYFSMKGELQGAGINTFLLESTRVVKQSVGERNFHIFYMIFSEQNAVLKDKFRLQNIESYFYLNQSNCYNRRDNVSDFEQLEAFKESMHVFGITGHQLFCFFQVVVAILNIGNIQFLQDMSQSNGNVSTYIEQSCIQYIEAVADFLSVPVQSVSEALTMKKMTVRNEAFKVPLAASQAEETRDILAKTLYTALFTWTLDNLNATMHTPEASFSKHKDIKTIPISFQKANFLSQSGDMFDDDPEHELSVFGLLDIFGFESLEKNSLEQLLINYCNESLQQQFDDQMIQAEQDLYISQGIEWSFITFPTSKDCIEFIAGKRASILTLLDEACIAPSGSDTSYINQLYSVLGQHNRMSLSARNRGRQEFGIKHYAGMVVYSSEGLVAKNTPRVFPLSSLLGSSSDEFIRSLASVIPDPPDALARRKSKLLEGSVCNSFKDSVAKLLDTINKTTPHYIKCIKPNNDNVMGNFNVDRVSDQLKSGGIIHTISVIRAGFPVRFTHEQFCNRYRSLIQSVKKSKGDQLKNYTVVEAISVTVQSLKNAISKNECVLKEYAVGVTSVPKLQLGIQCGADLVFLQQNAFLTLEKIMNNAVGIFAIRIQKNMRAQYWRKKFIKWKVAAIKIKTQWKRFLAVKKWKLAVLKLQKFTKKTVRKYFTTRKQSILTITRYLKGYVAKVRYLKIYKSILVIQRFFRRQNIVDYLDKKRFFQLVFSPIIVKLQRAWRRKYKEYLSALEEYKKRPKELRDDFHIKGAYGPRKTGFGYLATLNDESTYQNGNMLGKQLLQSNSLILWNIFCFYCVHKADIPSTSTPLTKRNNIPLVFPKDIISLCKDWGLMPLMVTQFRLKVLIEEILLKHPSPNKSNPKGMLSFAKFCKLLCHIAVAACQPKVIIKLGKTQIPEMNPEESQYLGRGLRYLFTVMDRSDGRTKFSARRETVLIPAFVGAEGAATFHHHHSSCEDFASFLHRQDSHRFRCIPMSPEVYKLMKKNESILVALALRYCAPADIGEAEFKERELFISTSPPPRATPFNGSPNSPTSQFKKDKKKNLVNISFIGVWKLLNDFGVCPDLCSKPVLNSLYELIANKTHESGITLHGGLPFDEFLDLLDHVAQNCKTSSDVCTPEGRVRLMFQVMNNSRGRQKLAKNDRNANLIPPLIGLDSCEPELHRRQSHGFEEKHESSFLRSKSLSIDVINWNGHRDQHYSRSNTSINSK